MDLFEKTNGLQIVHLAKQFDMYPYFRCLQGSKGNNVIFRDQDLVMMGSNNYLGLTHHPEVMDAAVNAVKQWGTGCTGSRFLNGNLRLHEDLEKDIAEFFEVDDAIVFATGFLANQGAIQALVGPDDHVFSDSENHACIIEGCRIARGKVHVYEHGDMKHLEELLQSVPKDSGKLIITDGVFSMTGHIAPYDKIHALAKKYSARTYIDDAHGTGAVGRGGRGTASHYGLDVDVLMGTFSKSLASQGGFVCGSEEVIDWIRHKARTFMFSAALSPANAAAAKKSLEILKNHPELVTEAQEKAAYLKSNFDSLGLNTMDSETLVIPVLIGDDQVALAVSKQLLELGVFTTPAVYPAMPKGQAVIRCSIMASHTKEDLDRAVNAFKELTPTILEANAKPDNNAIIDLLDETSSESIAERNRFDELGTDTHENSQAPLN